MHLQKQKNSRTFETQNQVEKSIFNFLTQNKAQAIRCKSCNFWYPAGSAATWAIIYKISSNMQNQKKTLHKTKASTPPITKVESRGNKPSKKLSLQNSKNSRTFEARYEAEQSSRILLIKINPGDQVQVLQLPFYPARNAATWALFTTFYLMRYEKKTPKTELEDAKPDQNLHFSKNNCTFEATIGLEQSNSKFLNQNKTQANRCKSCNFRLSGSVVSDLGFYLQTKSHMTTEKTPTQKPTTGTPPTIKVEFENAQDFVIYAQYSHMRAVIRGLKRKHLPNFFHSLAAPYQQQ